MEKLGDASKTQICTAEKMLKLLQTYEEEPSKLIDELRKLILNKSERQIEGMNSRLDFLRLLNHDNSSLDELDEAFQGQLSSVEKQWEMLGDEKARSEEALDLLIELGNIAIVKLEKEQKGLMSYFEFLCFYHKIVLEEKMADKSSKLQKLESLASSIGEIQGAKEVLLNKRTKLDEDLEETNKIEELLMATKRRLERDFRVVPHTNIAVKNEKLLEVGDEVVSEMANFLKPKPGGLKNNHLDVCKKEIDVQDSAVEIIEIEDDESSEASSSVAEVSHVEISSDDSDVQEEPEVSSRIKHTNLKIDGRNKSSLKLKTYCNQRKLHEFLSGLEGDKKRVIEESIFKPYLCISPRNVSCPLNLIRAMVETFDARADSFVIDNQPLKFCATEVEHCLGLKYDGRHVDFTTPVKRTPEIIQKYFGSQANISTKQFMEKLMEMQVNANNSADFFRLSVLAMFNVYFFPTAGNNMAFWSTRYLINLEEFNSYGWGRAIYDYLMTSIRKAANEVVEKVTNQAYVKGCLPLLEALVYERIGINHLKAEIDTEISIPFILKYRKGDNRPSTTITAVLQNLKFHEIKVCEGCSPQKGGSSG